MKKLIVIAAALMLAAIGCEKVEAQVVDPVSISDVAFMENLTTEHVETFSEKMNWVQVYTSSAMVTVVLYYYDGTTMIQKVPDANSPSATVPVFPGTSVEFKNLGDVVRVQVFPAAITDVVIYASKSRYQ